MHGRAIPPILQSNREYFYKVPTAHRESGGSRGFVLRPMKAGKGGKKGGTRRNRKKRKNSPGSILNCGKKKGGKERRWKKEEIEEGESGALRNDSMLTIK